MGYIIKERNRMRMRDKVKVGVQKYKKLMGKDFLIICEDGGAHIVRFFSKDFLHLTGILSDLSDEKFFERCNSGTLSVDDILEEQKYDWNTLKGKTNRIENIDQILYGRTENSLFMINLHTNTGNYPVAIRNSDIATCIGFRDNIHRARTLRKYANSANADSQQKILAIFGKVSGEKLYSEFVYLSDKEKLLEKRKDILDIVTENIRMSFEFFKTEDGTADNIDNMKECFPKE